MSMELVIPDAWSLLHDYWHELYDLKQVAVSDVVKDISLISYVGAELMREPDRFYLQTSRKKEDLRVHYSWMTDSRAGKGENQNFVNQIAIELDTKIIIKNPTSISSAIQIGGTGSDKEAVPGLYSYANIVFHDEFGNLFSSAEWQTDIFGNIRKNCDTYGTASNWLENSKICNHKQGGFHGISTIILTSFPILGKVKAIINSGTFQRFFPIVEIVDETKSNEIFDALKQKSNDINRITACYIGIRDILKRIKQEGKPISLGDEAYNKIVEDYKLEVAKHYKLNETEARTIRSYKVGQLLFVQKIAAIIGIVRCKSVVESPELEIARAIVDNNFNNLLLNTDFFGLDNGEIKTWVQDVRTALRDISLPVQKTEINNLMMKYWAKGETTTITRLNQVMPFLFRRISLGNKDIICWKNQESLVLKEIKNSQAQNKTG